MVLLELARGLLLRALIRSTHSSYLTPVEHALQHCAPQRGQTNNKLLIDFPSAPRINNGSIELLEPARDLLRRVVIRWTSLMPLHLSLRSSIAQLTQRRSKRSRFRHFPPIPTITPHITTVGQTHDRGRREIQRVPRSCLPTSWWYRSCLLHGKTQLQPHLIALSQLHPTISYTGRRASAKCGNRVQSDIRQAFVSTLPVDWQLAVNTALPITLLFCWTCPSLFLVYTPSSLLWINGARCILLLLLPLIIILQLRSSSASVTPSPAVS